MSVIITVDHCNQEQSQYRRMARVGCQLARQKINLNFAWAVHDGDVSAVPILAAVWLFGSGIVGLIGIAKHKKS